LRNSSLSCFYQVLLEGSQLMNTQHQSSADVVTRSRMLDGEYVAMPENRVRADAPLFWQEVRS
jgi:hypothetical protein